MRALNRSLTVLLLTGLTMALAGCLGTNTPGFPPALINESASGTGFIAARGAGVDTLTTTSNGANITGGAIDTGSNPATFTAYTNTSNGNYGFIANLPSDATAQGADTAVLNLDGGFTSATTGGVYPSGTQQSTIATDQAGTVSAIGTGGTADGGHLQVDKFGSVAAGTAATGLQDSEYGIWAENGTTAGLSATTATNTGVFAIGIPTAIMPNAGSATYTGGAAGFATSANGGGQFTGNASLTANFAVGGGTITGTVTNIKFLPAGDANIAANVGTMNNITFAGGTIAGNTFSGTTSVGAAPAPGATNLDVTGATGTFGGQFNGLNASEVAGTFKVSGGANTAAVIGSFGAKP